MFTKLIIASFFLGVFAVGIGLLGFILSINGPIFEIATEYRKDQYWGEGSPPAKEDTSVRPFKISVPDSVLIDLKDRLNRTRIQESLPGTNFEYGFNSNQLRRVVDYWLNKYDWKKQEVALNKFPQFKTKIEGLDIHFVHVKESSGSKNKIPLMMVHGFPGSFYEYIDTIPLLSDQFELVIPSLPGYGFSDASRKPGLNGFHIARIFVKLMKRLGHEKFIYHGGDWGAVIGRDMAAVFPEAMIGLHTTLPVVTITPRTLIRQVIAELGFPGVAYGNADDYEKLHPITFFMSYALRETGYAHIQSTKPDTVGVALNNDPAGLAAYYLEKFSTWTHRDNVYKPDGGLENSPYAKDKLLTNVMITWINQNVISSMRLYKEHFFDAGFGRYAVQVPTGVLQAKQELISFPRVVIEEFYVNIVSYAEVDGGHFLAFEKPRLFADNIKLFVDSLPKK